MRGCLGLSRSTEKGTRTNFDSLNVSREPMHARGFSDAVLASLNLQGLQTMKTLSKTAALRTTRGRFIVRRDGEKFLVFDLGSTAPTSSTADYWHACCIRSRRHAEEVLCLMGASIERAESGVQYAIDRGYRRVSDLIDVAGY